MKIENNILLDEFREMGRCEWCHKPANVCEPHHLRTQTPAIDIRINLLRVGSTLNGECRCHEHIQGNPEAQRRVLQIVAKRERTTPELITEVMDFVRRTIKPSPSQLERAMQELSFPAQALARRELMESGDLPSDEISTANAQLFLKIMGHDETLYLLDRLRPDQALASAAWRFRKSASESYDVSIDVQGFVSCTCMGATCRPGFFCKHARSLQDLGLLPKSKHTEQPSTASA